MTQEVGLFTSLGPEIDGVGQCFYCLAVSTDERATKVNMLKPVLFRLQIRDLADVVAISCQYYA